MLLGQLKNVDAEQEEKYRLDVGSAWFESVESLVWPVDVQYRPKDRAWALHSAKENMGKGVENQNPPENTGFFLDFLN